MITATLRKAAVLLLCVASPAVFAQDGLGDEFILFVDGANILIPNIDGASVVDDPADATNKVVRFSPGNWTEGGFAWGRDVGVDASASVGAAYGESDTLYFRMRSDVANAALGGIGIMIADATDDSGVDRPTAEGLFADADEDNDPDYQMRLVWTIPAELHDGEWHDLAIPLPPATYDALEAARTAELLMDGAENWAYTGAWSQGGFGIGGVGGTLPADDPLWVEFGWDQVYRIGPFWDNSAGADGGPIFMDNVYIGGPNTSTDGTTDQPTAMSGVTFSADDAVNTVSWDAVDGAGGYNVYLSRQPISDISASNVLQIGRIIGNEDLSITHPYELPIEGTSPTVHYAVTTLSTFGVENPDVSASTGPIANENLPVRAQISELTTDEGDALFDAVAGGTVTDAFATDHTVFVVDSGHRSRSEPAGGDLPDDSDVSALLKLGYTTDNELFVYGEVTDDQVVFAPAAAPEGDYYLYDSIEIGYGDYEVRDLVGGGVLLGSPHQNMERGDAPDYQFRFTGVLDEGGTLAGGSVFVANSLNDAIPGGSTVVEQTDTGWKFLSYIPMDAIQATGDANPGFPASDGVRLIPFNIAINDADATGQRESQIQWSIKPTASNQWWNTPAEWEVVALKGSDAQFVAAEDDADRGVFELEQSVPNPTAGRAAISFTLGAAREASVEVFNTLGQRVAIVADGEFAAGAHTVEFDTRDLAAGVYVYRLSAGDYVATRRMTVVR